MAQTEEIKKEIKKKPNKKDPIPMLNNMKKWKLDKKSGCRKKEVNYKQTFGGRFYPQKTSLVYLPSNIRNYLCNDYYYDVDIVNSMPSLLLNESKSYGIEKYKLLEDYVENREEFLNKLSDELNITRDDSKDLVLKVLFGAGVASIEIEIERKIPEILVNLKKEISDIRSILVHSNKYKGFIKQIKNDAPKNKLNDYWDGSYLSFILAKREWDVIESAKKYFISKKFTVSFLEFDGMKIKKNYKEITDKLIKDCEKYVKKNTNLDIKLKVKEMNTTIDLNQEDELTIFEDPDYMKEKEEFELTNCKIKNPVNYINWDNNQMYVKSRKEFKDLYENKPIKSGNLKGTPFINIWITDPNIRCYNKIDFEPNSKDETFLNGFDGFITDNMDEEKIDISLLFELIKSLTGNKESFEWYLDYLSHIIGCPEEKPNLAIIFYSEEEGIGKNLFIEWFGNKILKPKYIHVANDVSSIMEKHSLAFYNTLMCVVDETSGNESKKYTEKIKNNITCLTHNIQPKCVNIFTQKSFVRMFFLTNNRNSLTIGGSDRRFVAFEGDCKNANNNEYFSKVRKLLENPKTASTFYYFLKHRYEEKKITKAMLSETRPTSKLYEEMKTVDVTWRFLDNFFRTHNVILDDDEKTEFPSNLLYSNFKDYMKEFFESYKIVSYIAFCRKIASIKFEKKTNLTSKKLNGFLLDYKLFKQYLTDKKITIDF